MLALTTILVFIVTACAHNIPNRYNLRDNFVGEDFYDAFTFATFNDPTHGRVNYVDQETAQSNNLTYASRHSFIIRADADTIVDPDSRGRDSVRISSINSYTTHVVVADLRHMPAGPGTWPALWEKGDPWPTQGEIDIIEGVNDISPNLSSLHTTEGCSQPATGRNMTGVVGNLDCNARAQSNKGCGVQYPTDESYGPTFNAAGGGWYAIERTETDIKLWFWSRYDLSVPLDVRFRARSVYPDSWGTPVALFTCDECPLDKKFGPNYIIINLTFCGDWAGNVYPGGKAACEDLVDNKPELYAEAYWDFARMTVYV